MIKKFLYFVLFIVSILFSACVAAPSSTETPVEKLSDQENKTIVLPIATEPDVLNPYLSNSGWEGLISPLINESLAAVDPDGNYYPVLASEIPTFENGGVSQDGLTIIWKLKHDITWSDGAPFTSSDVKYTWLAASYLGNGVVWNPGISYIESVEIPDDYTVIIKYSSYYPDYLGQFSSFNSGAQGIFPEHYCGDYADMQNWVCNQKPIGTGPFMIDEWKSGEFIRLVRNPNYRIQGKPIVDQFLFPIVANPSTHYQMLINGEAHAWWFFDQQYFSNLANNSSVQIYQGSQQYSLRLFFNLNQNEESNITQPHPILGDINVRQAIRLAINPEIINKTIYNGMGTLARQEVFYGIYACQSPNLAYNVDLAKTLMDQAGFIDSNGDGIRECVGCLYGKEGQPAELVIVTTNDEEPLSLVEQLLVDELKKIGIRIIPQVDANFVERALTGQFDIMMWTDGYDPVVDPAEFMRTYYLSDSIPEWNIMQYSNSNVDRLFTELDKATNFSDRHQIICEIDSIITEDIPIIFLLAVPYPSALSSNVVGWEENPNAIFTWDAENWDLLH